MQDRRESGDKITIFVLTGFLVSDGNVLESTVESLTQSNNVI